MTRTKRVLICIVVFVLTAAAGSAGGWLLRESMGGSAYDQLQTALDTLTAKELPEESSPDSSGADLAGFTREEQKILKSKGISCRVSVYCACGELLSDTGGEFPLGNYSKGLPNAEDGYFTDSFPFVYEKMTANGKTYHVGAKSSGGKVVRVSIAEEDVKTGYGTLLWLMLGMGLAAGTAGAFTAWRLTRPKSLDTEQKDEEQ